MANPPKLYEVPRDARRVLCRECEAPMVYVPGKKPGSKLPLSVSSPLVVRGTDGSVIMAPSHFTDCTNPSRFSKRSATPPETKGSP